MVAFRCVFAFVNTAVWFSLFLRFRSSVLSLSLGKEGDAFLSAPDWLAFWSDSGAGLLGSPFPYGQRPVLAPEVTQHPSGPRPRLLGFLAVAPFPALLIRPPPLPLFTRLSRSAVLKCWPPPALFSQVHSNPNTNPTNPRRCGESLCHPYSATFGARTVYGCLFAFFSLLLHWVKKRAALGVNSKFPASFAEVVPFLPFSRVALVVLSSFN